MSKSINDIRCELIDNSNELIQNIIKYHSIVMDLQNINLLSFKIIKNQEEFTSLFKFIIDLNEIITQLIDYFKDVIKEEEELPNSKIAKTSFPDLKEKIDRAKSNQDMNSTMNPMMGGMGMNPMMGGMGMNPMMFGFQSPMCYPPSPKQSPTKENTESTNKTNKEDLNSSKKENEFENTESEHLKPNKKWYNNSIFSAIENMEIDRFKNDNK